jgi:penicillin-binding protein 1A
MANWSRPPSRDRSSDADGLTRSRAAVLAAWTRGRAAIRPALRWLSRPTSWLPLLFFATAGVGMAWGSWQNLCATCPSVAQIRTWEPEQTTKLLARDGRLLIEVGHERRTPVSITAIPPYVPQAVVAVEDKRFYQHGGFDPRGILRAMVGIVTGRSGSLGGGSTITQQLARNMFQDEIGFERRVLFLPSSGTIVRKLKEVQVALWLEESYTKDQILEAYLNTIYMGRGYGFQSAAQGYLGKSLSEVDPAEAALLAAILNRPGRYDPYRFPENATGRRNLVLDRMEEQGFLTEEETERWKAAPLPTEDESQGTYGIAPYFEEWVRQILDDRFGDEVYRGGLRVTTTLDLDIQRAAVESMEWGWKRLEDNPAFRHPEYAQFDTVEAFSGAQTPYIQGALIALDPHEGHVLAMVGGRDFVQSKFDRARLARRQAGSSFKPFVYAAAIGSGLPASHIVVDDTLRYMQADSTLWQPTNFEDTLFYGPITLREALRQSVNVATIRLGWEEVGLETVAQTAVRLGIQTPVERYPSMTIGAMDVIPLQMAEAYSAFATLGTRVTPFPILKVENARGELIWEPQRERRQVMDSLAARIVVSMLEDAANRGTGQNHRAIGGLPTSVPSAGKTGTTNDAADVWFIAFTPNLLATVWFGMDRPQPILRGTGATGGGYAAPVWGRFMRQVYIGTTLEQEAEGAQGEAVPAWPIPDPWPIPLGLTTREVDKKTGKLWAAGCPDPQTNRYTEIYIPGTEPTTYCDDSGSSPFRFRRPPPR